MCVSWNREQETERTEVLWTSNPVCPPSLTAPSACLGGRSTRPAHTGKHSEQIAIIIIESRVWVGRVKPGKPFLVNLEVSLQRGTHNSCWLWYKERAFSSEACACALSYIFLFHGKVLLHLSRGVCVLHICLGFQGKGCRQSIATVLCLSFFVGREEEDS